MAKIFGRLVLIALLIYAGVTLWYGRVGENGEGQVPREKEPSADLPAQKPGDPTPEKNDYRIILTRNIFKAVLELGDLASGEQQQEDLNDLAETKMQLVLLGTVSGSAEDARAIIRDETAKMEDIYRVGSEVHGAILTKIGRGKVVLQVNGREEILNIKDPENSGPQPESSPKAISAQPEIQTNQGDEGHVPEALPRRRISFRNATPASPVAGNTESALPEGKQVKRMDDQPVADDEAPLSGNGDDETTGQKPQ